MFNYWKIKEARKNRKMTQDQLASELGVKRAVISKYETGFITPSVEQAQKICDILNVPFLELIGVTPENNSDSERKRLEQLVLDYIEKHEEFELPKLLDLCYYDDNGLRFKGDNINFDDLVITFDRLNYEGQQKVAEYAEDILPRYRRQEAPQQAINPTEGSPTSPPCQQVGTDTAPQEAPQQAINSAEGKDTAPPSNSQETPPEAE